MTLTLLALICLWIGVSVYAVFGGADFGAGFWDLLAGSARRGVEQRARIAKSIGPVWEANHVWLIFSLVVLWTCFPPAFSAIASTLYIPSTIAAFGVVLRGAGFAFRKEATSVASARLLGATFALSSILTPFALGSIAGAVASGRVPPGIAAGNVVTSWINPTSILGGVLAVCVCAYTSAVLLCRDCERNGESHLAGLFRSRALVMAGVIAATGLLGIWVIAGDAPALHSGLLGHGLPFIVASAVFALAAVALLIRRMFTSVRVASAIAVVAAVWAWGAAQYPYLLPRGLTAASAAAPPATLEAVTTALGIGALLVVPSLAYLYGLAQKAQNPG
jgi:cytochrome bd ubiquinol oxidase subunit II